MKYIETSEHKVSMFRIWLTKTWPQHCNETLSFDGKPVGYSMDDWIKKNKWFLKRQYQTVVKKVRNTGKHA
jgi:hypothetical protein